VKPAYITTPEQFHAAIRFGDTRESRTLEFKGRYGAGSNQAFELRKDILSLANTFGGALIVGVNESNEQGYRRAATPSSPDIEGTMQWIANTVTERLHPVPDYRFQPLTIAHEGADVRVLVVNVHPFPDAIGGYYSQAAQEALLYPVRDDFGVRSLRAEEVARIMTHAPSRRIEITINEIAVLNQSVVVASPVYVARPESDIEYFSRLQRTYGVTTGLTTGHDHPHLPRAQVETPIADSVPIYLRRINGRQLAISFDGREVSIPFGIIRDVWSHSVHILGLLLDCDIVVPVAPRDSVRLRSRPARL
jgi:hypothetical protein